MKTTCDIRLYGLLDTGVFAPESLPALAHASLLGGVTLLQLRDKTGSTRQMVALVEAIRAACRDQIPLLVNDRVDVALASGAAGVHLGQEDMHAKQARALLGPDAIIGVTLKNQSNLTELDEKTVDYGCIGAVFATSSKINHEPPLGLEGLRLLRAKAKEYAPFLPIGAIAGIDLPRVPACIEAGADGIALISALYQADNLVENIKNFRQTIDQTLQKRKIT